MEVGVLPELGEVWVQRMETGQLCAIHLPGLDPRGPRAPDGARPLGEDLRLALGSYVRDSDGALAALPLAPAASEFAERVRKAMRSIPRGRVRTYGELAAMVGSPGAARAVGRACATNPLPLAVPCHRVVAATGPGGFGLGLEAKRTLWALEGIDIAMPARFR